jgi:hypothetical protein
MLVIAVRNMDKSKSLKTIENLVMPSSLTTLYGWADSFVPEFIAEVLTLPVVLMCRSCIECGVKTFRGVQLSSNLKTLYV